MTTSDGEDVQRDNTAHPTPTSSPRPKPSTPNTPQRASATPRTPAGHGAKTPNRKVSASGAGSAPARARTRKQEPTLLGDFLLGRPSPARLRRQSLEAVKKEMKEANMGKVQQPGGVKDRVKQWQQANAQVGAAAVRSPARESDLRPKRPGTATQKVADRPSAEDEANKIIVEIEESSADEELRKRVKYRGKSPGRKKPTSGDGGLANTRKRSQSAPRKRVISDEHWKSDRASTPPPRTIPANFTATNVNPPLERKIQDWVKRTEIQKPEVVAAVRAHQRHAKSNSFGREGDADAAEHAFRASSAQPDLGVSGRSPSPLRDGRREGGPEQSFSRGHIRAKTSLPDMAVRKSRSKLDKTQEVSTSDPENSERDVGNRSSPRNPHSRDGSPRAPRRELRQSSDLPYNGRRAFSYESAAPTEDNTHDSATVTTKDRPSTARSQLDTLSEVPFGDSAFSVIDLPVGADAHMLRTTMRKNSRAQRSSSFRMPSVLKKVYTEGMKIMQETANPPAVALNQPPSIETWLNNTTDPFVDAPKSREPQATSEGGLSRQTSYKVNDITEKTLTASRNELSEEPRTPNRRQSARRQSSHRQVDDAADETQRPHSASKVLDHEANGSPKYPDLSRSDLRRSPATRVISSPQRNPKKMPFKDAVREAFRGESVTVKSRATSTPVSEMAGSRSRESTSSSSETQVERGGNAKSTKPDNIEAPTVSPKEDETSKPPSFPFDKRRPPTNGAHVLSTIASVATLSTVSSSLRSASQVTESTITQESSLLSRSSISRKKSNATSLHRRLTKNSDLMSVLSLPDSAAPGKANSIRSARSVRTTRRRLEIATVDDLMHEVADDEAKYMRELKTLVDGVIPVLLTCVLSKSKTAEAAGLFDPNGDGPSDSTYTQPIVDMGIALERLKSLHRRIPLDDPDMFVNWALRAHQTYLDYTKAWRLGFHDVVVNLAPASRRVSSEQQPILDGVPRNKDGDVVDTNGERVDVAYLLKRPMTRIKFLQKATKGIAQHKPSNLADKIAAMYDSLLEQSHARIREEQANLEDRLANSIDTSRVRDPRSMDTVEDVQIDTTRRVIAKDIFSLTFISSCGQRLECRIELFLRDDASGTAARGDVLICSVDDFDRYLLFPPISRSCITAQQDEQDLDCLEVDLRGFAYVGDGDDAWHEVLDLEAEDVEIAAEWAILLGGASSAQRRHSTNGLRTRSSVASFAPSSRLAAGADFTSPDAHQAQPPLGIRRRRATRASVNRRLKSPDASVEHHTDATSPVDTTDEPRRSYERVSPAVINIRNSQNGRPKVLHKHTISEGARSASDTYPTDRALPSSREGSPTYPDRGVHHIRSNSQPDARSSAQTPHEEQPNTDMPPPPPPHKSKLTKLRGGPVLDPSRTKSHDRRTSSPLKHEYQPSHGSDTSQVSEAEASSDSESDGAYSSDSSDEELDVVNIPEPSTNTAGVYSKQLSRSASIYSLPNTSLAPSNSASQGPYRGMPKVEQQVQNKRIIATISCWSDAKGRWEDLWNGPCSILVSPGLIAAYEITASHSRPTTATSSKGNSMETDEEVPLVAQVLTPLVPLRQSTMIDIEIKSPPTQNSRLKSTVSVRYRAQNTIACGELYQAIHQARLDNIIYKRLEAERTLAGYGTNPYEKIVHRRSWFFGRRRSYRAQTTHAASRNRSTDQTQETSSMDDVSLAPSFLRRYSRGSFNIARSSVARSMVDSAVSLTPPASSSPMLPPRANSYTASSPPSISLSGTASRFSFAGSTPVDLGTSNLKIRLYCLETSTRWSDTGGARLTVTTPPPGMKQESFLYQGIQRRVLVSRRPIDVHGLPDHSLHGVDDDVVFDRVVGGHCFSKVGRTGVCVNVWEDVRGPNGEIGMVGAFGGVSGRTRKWCFQAGCKYDADWIYNLVAVGRE